MDRRRAGRVVVLGVLPFFATLLVACGDDDESPSAGDGATADESAYCDAIVEVETVSEPEIDFETASPAEIETAIKAFASEDLLPLAKDVQEVAPDEIADDVDTLVAATEELAETGDFEAAFGPDEVAAEEAQHSYDLEHCGWGQADVAAQDYAFAGMEASYDEGIVSFDLTNSGDEMHELALVRKKDGVTQSIEDLLSMGEEESARYIDFVGGLEPIAPGEDAYMVADLEKGEYVAVCFLPVGATPEVFEALESGQGQPPEGPPHAIQGMVHEFTVE